MPDRPRYRPAEHVLVRMPLLARDRAEATWTGPDPDRATAGQLRDHVLALAADPLVREAVAVSSGSLSATLDRVEAGDPVEVAKLARATQALTRYVLRATSRATPFGQLAGVALGRLATPGDVSGDVSGEEAKVRLGGQHVRHVRPDLGWLAAVVRRCERDPAVLRTLQVQANDLAVERGGRWVLDARPAGDPGRDADRPAADGADRQPGGQTPGGEVSLRLTGVVRAVLASSRRPVKFIELLDLLVERFPAGDPAVTEAMLVRLVELDLLRTGLQPPVGSPDPLGHVLAQLDGVPGPALSEQLAGVRAALGRYAASPLGQGRAAWEQLGGQVRAVAGTVATAHVDLQLDTEVRLPPSVATEVARAADLLLGLAPDEIMPSYLSSYHQDFVARYGLHRWVPLRELLDPQRGLGAPAGYQFPAGDREAGPGGSTPARTVRDQRLIALAQDALLDRRREVELDDDLLAALERTSPASAPAAVELYATLVCASVPALSAGDYRLVVGAASGARPAGSTLGRFARMLDGGRALGDLAAANAAADPHRRHVQLVAPALIPRMGNVMQAPEVLPARLAVGGFDPRDPDCLGLDDLVVGADEQRLRLCSLRDGAELVPVAHDMLNDQVGRPNAARLVREIGLTGARRWHAWDWGAAADLPFLPRVRRGRIVLAGARWRPGPGLDPALPWPRWLAALQEWRHRWQVPALVHAVSGESRLELNLDVALHRKLLWQELRRAPELTVQEPPGGDQDRDGTGWLGGHCAELVFTLIDAAGPVPGRRAAGPVRRRAVEAALLPGGDWLHAKLYAGRRVHDELLADHLPRLVAALPEGTDRWFFLRYADPDPHLRVRFHGDAGALGSELLPRLHAWAEQLHAIGLLSRMVLDGYDPEWERYGGPELIDAVERVFHADSLAALAQLRLRRGGGSDLPIALHSAANHVDILRALGDPDWARWLRTGYPRGAGDEEFRRHRAAALQVIDPVGDWAGLRSCPGGDQMLHAWSRRRTALGEYGELFRRVEARGGSWSTWTTVVGGILHLQHNRLAGGGPRQERASYAIARGAVAAHLDRARHQRGQR